MQPARPTKEFILAEIQRIAAEDGKSPSMRRFEAATGIVQHVWMGRYWARWNDAVLEAGLQTNEWNTRSLDDAALVKVLAEVTREFGRFPARAEYQMHRRSRPGLPEHKVFLNRLGPKERQVELVRDIAQQDPAFADIASLLPAGPETVRAEPAPQHVTGYVYLIKAGEFHKIGMTNHLGRRIFQIELQLPEKAELVHHIETDDPRGIEAYWHNRFKESRANGEWFKLHPADIAAFKRRTYM